MISSTWFSTIGLHFCAAILKTHLSLRIPIRNFITTIAKKFALKKCCHTYSDRGVLSVRREVLILKANLNDDLKFWNCAFCSDKTRLP